MSKKSHILKVGLGVVVLGAAIALPIVAVNNSLKASTSFSTNKIGIYVENSWMPAYKLAVEKYNKRYPDRKYDIQMLELGAFNAMDMVDKLGYADQKIADLIYTPVDRIPSLVQSNGALMGFDSPEAIISDEFDAKIYEGSTKEAFAKKGEALVIPPDSQEGTEPKPFYFGIPHSTEALILYYRGFSEQELTTIESLANYVNEDKWTNSMYSFKFNDLWYALGLIAGFIEKECVANGLPSGTGQNGQLIGKALVSKTTTNLKYQSNVVNIDGQNETLQDYVNTPGWNESGLSANTDVITTAITNAINFIAKFYNASKVENKILGTKGNDWLLDGNNFSPITEKMLKDSKAQKAVTIDGPWMVSSYKNYFTNAIAVPPIVEGAPYLQAPGGWLYCINQRNANNPEKIRDMKRFLNILLSDEEVIKLQYTSAGKIIEGNFSKSIMNKYADEIISSNNKDKLLEANVIKAVFASKTMDQRPDGGNAEFSQVWGAWNEKGITSTANVPGYSNSIKDILVSTATQGWTDERVQAALRKQLITSFTAMLNGLRGK